MDLSTVLSYLTSQQILGQPLIYPMFPPLPNPCQSTALPLSLPQPAATAAAATTHQLIAINQYFKSATVPTTSSSATLLHLLSAATFPTPPAPITPQSTASLIQPTDQKAHFLTLFDQLVQAQQTAVELQSPPPMFVDDATILAALSTQPTESPMQLLQSEVDRPDATALFQSPINLSIIRQPSVTSAIPSVFPAIRVDTSKKLSSARTTVCNGSSLRHKSPIKPAPIEKMTSLGAVAAAAAVAYDSMPELQPAVASTSKSSSVDEDEEMEELTPEDQYSGRQRRAEHIAFHRRMKTLLKSMRGTDIICKLCGKQVERHDNAFKTHIADHVDSTSNRLQCRYCGFETPSRSEMNMHMGEKHPAGSERAYTDKRDHMKMIEIMNECFAKTPRFVRKEKDPVESKVMKPRGSRRKKLSHDEYAAAAAGESPTAPPLSDTFEDVIVRFCSTAEAEEVICGCGDVIKVNPSALLVHLKTLHARYKCADCGDVLHSATASRAHTVKMHGKDEHTYAERISDNIAVDCVRARFMECFVQQKQHPHYVEKSLSVSVLHAQMDVECKQESIEE